MTKFDPAASLSGMSLDISSIGSIGSVRLIARAMSMFDAFESTLGAPVFTRGGPGGKSELECGGCCPPLCIAYGLLNGVGYCGVSRGDVAGDGIPLATPPAGGAIIIGGGAMPTCGLLPISCMFCCGGYACVDSTRAVLGGGAPFHLPCVEGFLRPPLNNALTRRIKTSVSTIGGPRMNAFTPKAIKSALFEKLVPVNLSIRVATAVSVLSQRSMNELS